MTVPVMAKTLLDRESSPHETATFTVSPANVPNLAPGAITPITVTFNNPGPGNFDAFINVEADGQPAGGLNVHAFVEVAGPPPLLFTPSSLDFGIVAEGINPTLTFTIKNDGNVPTDIDIFMTAPDTTPSNFE